MHLFRAQEVVFAFKYGMDIMKNIGIDAQIIRAGKRYVFKSDFQGNTCW
jgi:xylulokinase